MTKKDYISQANIFKIYVETPKDDDYNASLMLVHLIQDFTDMLAKDNPRFDKIKFLKACGL